MVCWFAGLFYLPRLFVYHAELSSHEPEAYKRFCTMERKLYRGIMTPSMLVTLVLGIGLMHSFKISWHALPNWLSLKLALVAMLVIYHFYCGKVVRQFQLEKNTHSSKFYRFFNEFPALLLIAIVLLVVLKPF
jgi:putative membrane protein